MNAKTPAPHSSPRSVTPTPEDAAPERDALRAQRREKRARLKELDGDPFLTTRFAKTHGAAPLKADFAELPAGARTETRVAVAGRVMAIRNSGMFIDLQDDTGRLQVFHDLKAADETTLLRLKLLDLGDVIGVEGIVRRTPRGELTVDAERLRVLAKAMEPPPEKYHGIKDIEHRFRHREQDIATNDKSRTALRKRYEMVAAIRRYLDGIGFLEVETPILHTVAGGALATPFKTHHKALDLPLTLRIATELHLKRLVIGGLSEKVYEIGRIFRNEGISPKHNPEFTSIELYEAYVNYETMMARVEGIIEAGARAVTGGTAVHYAGQTIDFTPPFRRATMLELIKDTTGIDFRQHREPRAAAAAAEKIGIHLAHDPRLRGDALSWGKVVEVVFGEKVEASLVQPTHVCGIPRDISPLAKGDPQDSLLAERFETYVNGFEVANAFSELNDPDEQRARFMAQAAARDAGDDEAHPIDEEFLTAMAFGMPPMGGLGLGIDRLAMLLTDSATIKEIIAFPTLRPADHGVSDSGNDQD